MGNCCGGTPGEGEVNIMRGSSNKNMAGLFDEREVLGLRGQDKIALIVKIQAMFRGALARRRVRKIHGF